MSQSADFGNFEICEFESDPKGHGPNEEAMLVGFLVKCEQSESAEAERKAVISRAVQAALDEIKPAEITGFDIDSPLHFPRTTVHVVLTTSNSVLSSAHQRDLRRAERSLIANRTSELLRM